jgi:replication factor A1
MRIEDLKPGMQDFDIVGRIVKIVQPRDFTRRDGSTGYVCSLLLADQTGSARLTLWDQECRLLEEVSEQDILKIVGGICKSGRRGLEIHTRRRARMLLDPKVSEDPRVSDLESVVEASIPAPPRRKISELQDGDTAEIRATVVRLYRVWTYDACPNCGRKVVENTCKSCGVVSPIPRAIVDVGVDDSSGFMRAKFFGEMAEEFLGVNAAAVRCGVDALLDRGMDARRASEDYLNREHMDVLGNEIQLRGRVELDEYRGLVLTVDGLASPNPIQETLKVLEEIDV